MSSPRRRVRNAVRLALLFGVAPALLISCKSSPFGYVSIAGLVAHPADYEGKPVKIQGTVVDAVKLPLAPIRYYVLRDDKVEVTVFAKESLPTVGDQVTVSGVATSAAVINNVAFGLHVNEEQRW